MIIAKHVVVGEYAHQFRRAGHLDPALFLKLAPQGIIRRFTALNAAAGQEQPLRVCMADEQDLAVRILDQPAYPQRHWPGQAKPGPEQLRSQVKQYATPRFQFQGSPNR